MRPFIIPFPGQLANAIAATQSVTATAGGGVILNGSVAPRANTTPSATTASTLSGTSLPVVLAGVARPVTVFATTSATNCVFRVIGLDLNGNAITASFVGASGGSATATDSIATGSGVDFHVINGVITTASVANFTVGFGATGVTNWCEMDIFKTPFAVTVGGELTATLTTYTVQDTPDNVQTTTNPVTFNNSVVNAIATTSLQSNYAFPARYIRGIVTTNSATGGVTFFFTQAGA